MKQTLEENRVEGGGQIEELELGDNSSFNLLRAKVLYLITCAVELTKGTEVR